MYAHHLDRWLLYFPPQQISVIDGEQLRLDPVTSMTKLQHFLKIRPIFDYSLHLRYDFLNIFFLFIIVNFLPHIDMTLAKGSFVKL